MFNKTKFNLKTVLILFLIVFCFYSLISGDEKNEQPKPEVKKVETRKIESTNSNPQSQVNENLNGRGFADNGREEPKYIGVKGYVVVPLSDYDLMHSENSLNGDWKIPTYQQDKQFWIETGQFLNHKTEVLVKNQILEHSRYGAYTGYLLVQRLSDNAEFYVDVGNFVTKPYWNYEIKAARATGLCIAVFNQISNFYPVNNSGQKVELPNGIKVLVVMQPPGGKVGIENNISALVWKQWQYGYGAVDIYFNEQDLKIIY